MSDQRRFGVSEFATNADRFDAYDELCDKLEAELSTMTQRAEAAEARIREAQEQEPHCWIRNGHACFELPPNLPIGYAERKYQPLYAAPIPPADVAELERKLRQSDLNFDALEKQNATLTRKLAEQQAVGRAMKCQCVCGGEEELTKLLEKAKRQAVPEFSAFNEWMHKEIPSGTIIGDAGWWASRIYRKFIAPPAQQPETDTDQAKRLR